MSAKRAEDIEPGDIVQAHGRYWFKVLALLPAGYDEELRYNRREPMIAVEYVGEPDSAFSAGYRKQYVNRPGMIWETRP